MPKLSKTIVIEAPVEKVFAYVDKPAHLPEIWPSLFEVKDAGGSSSRRSSWRRATAGCFFT